MHASMEHMVTDGLRGRIPGLSLKVEPHELDEYTIRPYGDVQMGTIWDSRVVYGQSEELGSLFPAPIIIGKNGEDINTHPHFHMSITPTTFGLLIRGPDITSGSTFGAIETDFRGSDPSVIGCLHVRHAFGMASWKDGYVLFGQFWHPLVVPQCWPHVISFNGGAPFETIARDPQFRMVKRFDNLTCILAMAGQRDYASNGPLGKSPEYIRDAVIPNLHGQLRYYGESYLCGAAFDYKRLKPRLVSAKNFDVHEHIDSFIAEAYMRVDFDHSNIRLKGIWAQNANDQGLISGFGIKTINPVTQQETYANTAAASFWIDSSYFFTEHFRIGLFGAYAKNLGSFKKLYIDPTTKEPIIYALLGVSQNIDQLFRISPRVVFEKQPFLIAFELEYINASWGKPNEFGKVERARPVGNVRFVAQINYVF